MSDFAFVSPNITAENLTLYNVREKPFSIYGLYEAEKPGIFRRMEREAAEATSERVKLLHTNTAGGRIRFETDSQFIAVGAVFPPMTHPSERTALLCGAGAFCFDMYSDGKHWHVLWPQKMLQRGSVMSFDVADGQYESCIMFPEKKMRQITLFFPTYVNISDVFIGLHADSTVAEGEKYKNDVPVVFYGSSITQGACASRSGNTYQNVLSRKFNFDYLNLGFAGACKAEDVMIDYLCDLDMSMLVYDYDHNAPSCEYLESTHLPALRRLRNAHKDIPIILLSKPNIHSGKEQAVRRMEIVKRSYETMKAESDAPIHFVSGQDIFTSHDSEMMTIDGTHPTDLGHHAMADALSDIFKIYF